MKTNLREQYPDLFSVIKDAGPVNGKRAFDDLEKLYHKQFRDGVLSGIASARMTLETVETSLKTGKSLEELEAVFDEQVKNYKLGVT